MKKQLLSIIAALAVSSGFAQVPAAAWSTNQDAVFPATPTATLPGVKFIDAVDANVVWAIGYDGAAPNRSYNWYSRTINGGTSFSGGNVFNDTNTYVISNMEGIDANTAWVSAYKKVGPGGGPGGGGIFRTTNGGTNWVNMTPGSAFTNSTSFTNWVAFLTPSVGIADGDPVNGHFELWRTTDGGITWNLTPTVNVPSPLAGEFAIVNLYAKVGTSNLWFGTNGNRIFRTTDAGLTYSVASVGPITNTVTQIAFSSPLNGVCYMVNASAALELWHSFDGGATWTQITPVSANLGQWDVTPIPGTGYLASYGAGNGNTIISYSSDNGVTWTDWGSTGIPYSTGDFVNGSIGWAGSFKFTDASNNTFTDVWKYSGATITGTVSPTAAFSVPATICLGSTPSTVMPVNTSTGSPAPTYSWSILPSGASLSSATASAPVITFSTANNYTITLVATNSTGTNSTTWVVNVTACTAPVSTFTIPATACTGFSFMPSNTSAGAPTPGYLWSVSPASSTTLSSASASAPAIQIGTAGTYSISLMVSNASGTAQTTQTIAVTACPPVVGFTMPGTICFVDGPPTMSFQTTNTTTNPAGATGGSLTYTWTISPSAGVSVLPNYFAANLTKVTITSTTTPQYTVTLKAKNPSGIATYTQTINAAICTGIQKNTLSDNLSVFPNPAHDQLNIMLPASSDTYNLRLTNILGSVLYNERITKDAKDNVVITLNGKPKGIYFLTVESSTEKATKKIVVE